ncbi:MAG: cation:proton antiporter [Gemmatimonadaceae bacterium]
MPHETALLYNLAAAFAVAFVFGYIASRLKLPPLAGYLLAGVALGPHSPAFVGDVEMAGQLAEIGVVLLMFGVGLHFSPSDLMRVKRVALPGGLLQMGVATLLGVWLAKTFGWDLPAAIVFGIALSVASTVVVLRVLESRGDLDSADGRVVVGWLVVQDLGVVLVLVLLPAILSAAGAPSAVQGLPSGNLAWTITLTLLKVAAFIVLMGLVGRRAVPWLLTHVARTGSRELFTLSVLVVALGIAVGAASLFGVSFALGAFVAGVVISESDLSYRAGSDALPMQDAFAVLFFVSVGMLLDPNVFLTNPLRIAATVGIVVLGNSVVAAILLVLYRQSLGTALRLGASLGQIGEFSFILAGLGVSIGVLPELGRSFILATAFVTIVANPLLFAIVNGIGNWLNNHSRIADLLERQKAPRMIATNLYVAQPVNHAIIVGYGRVGRTIGDALTRAKKPFVAIEQDRRTVEAMRTLDVVTVYGDATRHGILDLASPDLATVLIIAVPDPFHARHVIELARKKNPGIDIVVRTHSDQAQELFDSMGVRKSIMGERELAFGMALLSLQSLGLREDKADLIVSTLRGGDRMPTKEFSALMPRPRPDGRS